MSDCEESTGPEDALAIYKLLDRLSDLLGEAISAGKGARSASARRIATTKITFLQGMMLQLARANYRALPLAERRRHDAAIEAYAGGPFSDYLETGPEEAPVNGVGSEGAADPSEEQAEGEWDPPSHGFFCQCVAAGYLGCRKDPSGVARYSLAAKGAGLLTKLRMSN